MKKRIANPLTAGLIYPHQLFDPHPVIPLSELIVLVEEPLFFTQFNFHRQKRMLHRASMKQFAALLEGRGIQVKYLDIADLQSTEAVVVHLQKWGVTRAQMVDPSDDWLRRKLEEACAQKKISLSFCEDPHFLTSASEISNFVQSRKRYFFHEFYIGQRQRFGILLDKSKKPIGGRWSFDQENRKRLPKDVKVPAIKVASPTDAHADAAHYVRQRFPDCLGAEKELLFPSDHASAARWLNDFIEQRLRWFGDYEDAISTHHSTIFHSVLTPMLNTGLLSPRQVLDAVLDPQLDVPLNSLEGFVRQILGWREYVRLIYLTRGRHQRTQNFWKFKHPVPSSFYDGTTGIAPVDQVIRKVLRHGYCHHIERLMILGNFMLLCGIHPDGVYQWFMEFFVDAYDWVMVPNIYGMSQYADGGLMTTKPYISGSAYVLKMSDHPKGDWCPIWDALYWNFIDQHRDFFSSNPRTGMMVKLFDRLGPKQLQHRKTADAFLKKLHRG